MAFKDRLLQIDQLQESISKHGKIPAEVLKKINYKFRLEWNYYSNSMEGNTLTQDETRTVMVGNITVEGKPLQDIMEMSKHDEVITDIIRIGKGELNISEKRIKDIHTAIMYEEDAAKSKKIGQWKTEANHLYNYRGEKFDFVAPADVKEEMHKLVNWVNGERDKIQRGDKNALHPVELALKFHLDYVSIHPFYDGNGRTSRIFCNLILISYGYPPIYVKTDEREEYYRYLADIQAYGGNPDLLYDFMARMVVRSQEIVLNAIEGKEIEEPSDLDKRLKLLENQLKLIETDDDVKIELDGHVFNDIYNDWLEKFIVKSIHLSQKFNRFFSGTRHLINFDGTRFYFDDDPDELITNSLYDVIERNKQLYFISEAKVIFQTDYGVFKKGGLKGFNCKCGWEINFNKYSYEVILVYEFYDDSEFDLKAPIYTRLLHKPLSDQEMNDLIQKLGNAILNIIETNAKKIKT
ncbi:MAG: Fic family protein [Bacteroidetes bacterium]|nr:Fic family protein [Bacteroidota bacterium]